MTRTLAAAVPAALLIALLAGCSGAARATTHLHVHFGGLAADVNADVASDLASRPTAAQYAKDRIAHKDGYTAHDQLEDWSRHGGQPYAATAFNSSFGAGYFLKAIGSVSADGTHAYWSLAVNGALSDVGMSDAVLKDGDTITWTYTPVAAAGNGSSSSPVKVTVAPVAPTQGDKATVAGTVDRPTKLTVMASVGDAVGFQTTVQADKAWSAQVPLAYGHNSVEAFAADGGAANVTIVRLASGTFVAKYTAYPIHPDTTDTVWYDPGTFASAPQYAGKSAPRADTFSVHDFMADWTAQTGKAIEYGYSDSFGYSVSKIDGVGQPVTASAPPYWCYKLDGQTADLGISLEPFAPGQTLTWEYAGCA